MTLLMPSRLISNTSASSLSFMTGQELKNLFYKQREYAIGLHQFTYNLPLVISNRFYLERAGVDMPGILIRYLEIQRVYTDRTEIKPEVSVRHRAGAGVTSGLNPYPKGFETGYVSSVSLFNSCTLILPICKGFLS